MSHLEENARLSFELEEARDTIERLIEEKRGITKQRDTLSIQFAKAMEENLKLRKDECCACGTPINAKEHLEGIAEKLIEVREELVDQGNDFRLVPLSHQDSGCVLAVCESIGVDLIPLTPWQGAIFLKAEQLAQLNEAMEEFLTTNAKGDSQSPNQ